MIITIFYLIFSLLNTGFLTNSTEINASINHREKRAVLRDPRYKWNIATFSYDIDPSLKDDTIILGLLMIKQRTCLKFIRANQINRKSAHILYIPGAIYLTNLGYRGKLPHKIMVPKHDKDPARIARETLRALGFDYEHNRSDRDFYLYISFKYLHMDVKPLFYRKPPATVKTFDLNYDYRSIMHFAAHELCKKGRKCIKTRKGGWLVEETMGRATKLTFNDAKLVNLQYCTSLIAVKRKKCLHQGYPPGRPLEEFKNYLHQICYIFVKFVTSCDNLRDLFDQFAPSFFRQ